MIISKIIVLFLFILSITCFFIGVKLQRGVFQALSALFLVIGAFFIVFIKF